MNSLGYGDPPVTMKPASAYNYNQEAIKGKFSEDLHYVLHGSDGNVVTRIVNIFTRDWGQASTNEKVDLVLSATGPLFRVGKYSKGTFDSFKRQLLKRW